MVSLVDSRRGLLIGIQKYYCCRCSLNIWGCMPGSMVGRTHYSPNSESSGCPIGPATYALCVNGSEYKGKTKPSLPTLGINGKEV